MGKNMKKTIKFTLYFKILIITAVLCIASLSVIAVENNENNDSQITMSYAFKSPVVTKIQIENEVYDQLNILDASCSGNVGEPSLPTKGSYLLLPHQTKVKEIKVTGESTFLGSGFKILPQSKPIPISKIDLASRPIPNEIIYNSENEFPGRLFTKVGIYYFRGYPILVLMLHPVQYIPATGEAYYYSNMDVKVILEKDYNQNSLFRGLDRDKQQVIKKVDNPEIVDTYSTSPGSLMEEYDLLIVTTDELKSDFEPLKNVHDNDGISTVIKTLTDIGGSTSEDLRDYIRDAYNDWGIEYVLLGGDSNVVPEKIFWVFGLDENTTPYETYLASDLYYGCLDGPYNYDGDDKWGEPTDGEGGGDVDLVADVYVGRACVGNSAEVSNFVEKTISYLSVGEDDYLNEVVMAGEYLGDYGIASWGGNYCDQLVNGSSDDGYTTVGISADEYNITKLYDRDWPGNDWPKSEIMNHINNGVYIINHLGHSSYDYNLKMSNSDVSSLTNDKYCFVYSQGCMAGGFDQGDCIAEYFTVKGMNGAFAGIWNADYGWFWSYSTDGDSQRFHRQFWDAVFGEDISVISKANSDSKEDNLYIIDRSCIRWVYYETNLFGDPTLSIHGGLPRPRIEISDIKGGLGISASLENAGDADATNIDWSISVNGGLLNFINVQTEGNEPIAIGETITVKTDKLIFGIGKVEISISATYSNTWSGEGFVFGPFILGLS